MAAQRRDSDDDYWTSSQAQKLGKNVNLFDDNVQVDDAKQWLSKMKFETGDDDDIDLVGWDGSTVSNVGTNLDLVSGSARYRPTNSPAGSLSKTTGGTGYGIPTKPPAGRPNILSGIDRQVTAPPSSYNEKSISDVVGGGQTTNKKPTHTEVAKLETEVNFLRRELQASKKDRYAAIPPRTMILRMINGEPYTLECYKAKEEKQQLLDEAIKLHDGNAITAAVLFLKNSIKHATFQRELLARPVATEHYVNYLRQHYEYEKLVDMLAYLGRSEEAAAVLFLKNSIKHATFQRELLARPVATEHYVNYLRQHYEYEKLVDMLAYLGRSEEAAMIKYRHAVVSTNPETKIKSLQTCGRTHFNMDAQLTHQAAMIQEQVAMLERQLPVEKADSLEAQKGVGIFRDHPRKATIIDQPVITTLYYSCFYHYGIEENNFASPVGIKNAHKLTDRQYVWVAVAARARLRQWKNIETLFQTKGWLGGTKMKAIVPFDRLVHLLKKLDAPREVTDKYCNLISDTRKRLEVGQKLGCHGSVIETYVHMKDRQALVAYQSKLKPHTQEWFFAGDMLRNTSNKWKN